MFLYAKCAVGERKSGATLFCRTLASIAQQKPSGRAAAAASVVEDVFDVPPTHTEVPTTEHDVPADSEKLSSITASDVFCYCTRLVACS